MNVFDEEADGVYAAIEYTEPNLAEINAETASASAFV